MHEFLSLLNHVSTPWSTVMLRASLMGGTTFALLWALCHLWPKMSPTGRSWLWRAAFGKLLLALFWQASVGVPILPAPAGSIPELVPASAPPSSLSRAVDLSPHVVLPRPQAARVPVPHEVMTSTIPNVAGIAFICWLAGVAFFVRRGMMAWRTARRLRAGSELLNDLTLRTMVDELRGRFGMVRSPELRRCSELDALALTGVFQPAILLPAKLITSGEAELKLMLAHELAHQKRGDLAWNWLLWTGQTLFWFHPVVWLAAREWRLAQEVACDAMAVRETHSPVATYGAMLLKIVLSGRSACPENLFAVGVGERYATLHRRLSAMKYFSGMAESRYALLVCAAVATGIVVPWHVTTLPALAQTSPSSVLDSKSEGAGARASPTAAAPLPDAQLLASRSANNGQAVAGALVHDPTRQTLHALSGSGVVITLSDKPIKSKMTSPFIPGIVHDFDIRRIVNELQAANAEGIAINGVRMTNSTAIRCIGPNIHIGQQVVQHPYRVEAIGDPQALVGALSKKGGVLTSLKPWEHNIRVARANHLRLPTRPVP